MKYQLTFIFTFLIGLQLFSQDVPQGLNYQGVARDAQGEPLNNEDVSLRISILNGSGDTEYQERQRVRTSSYGHFQFVIGEGSRLSSNRFSDIDWSSGDLEIETEIDINGGANYEFLGTSLLQSVPYAMYALNSATPGPEGPQGPEGPRGPEGLQGPEGPQGAEGPQGPRGDTGMTGPEGPQGPQGNDGAEGARGPEGPRGDVGPRGSEGPEGPRGLTGQTGPRGPQGDRGEKGDKGDPGSSNWNLLGGNLSPTNGSYGVGIGTQTPRAKLEVIGAVKIGDQTVSGTGSIRYRSGDFQGLTASGWKSFTSSGGEWTRRGTSITYNAGFVGIGNTSPGMELHVTDRNNTDYQIRVSRSSNTWQMGASSSTSFRLQRSGSTSYAWLNANYDWGKSSDERLKENIVPVTSALEKIMKLNIVQYNYIGQNDQHVGLLAQEVEKVFPELVSDLYNKAEGDQVDQVEAQETRKAMLYTPFIYHTMKAMQEQQEMIEKLEARIIELENK